MKGFPSWIRPLGQAHPLSPEAKRILNDRIGCRCESAYGSGVRNAREVFEHEVYELGNDDMILDAQRALGLKVDKEVPSDPAPIVDEIVASVDRRFGSDAVALWVGTKDAVKKEYCNKTEEPDCYRIPKSALLVTDLGDMGQLFFIPKEDYGRSRWGSRMYIR